MAMYKDLAEYFGTDVVAPCPRGHVTNLQCSTDLVSRYIHGFTGACFDPRMDEPWWNDNAFNASDMYGVAALSMPHMIRSNILEEYCEFFSQDDAASKNCNSPTDCTLHIGCLLSRIPRKAEIWSPDAEKYLVKADSVWNILFENRPDRVGDVGVNKLVSRKRPGLLPVVDDVTRKRGLLLTGGKKPKSHWSVLHSDLNPLSPDVVVGIQSVRKGANVPDWTFDLRVIDIIVWMHEMRGC